MSLRDPCAVCDATNAHTRLCRACKLDPTNAGWDEQGDDVGARADMAETAGSFSWADLIDRPLRDLDALEVVILDLVTRGRLERVPYVDRAGRRRGTYLRRKLFSYRAIAAELGVSRMKVARLVRRIFFC